jgi:thymidylate synthase ThyX
MIYSEKFECMKRDELRRLQGERLKERLEVPQKRWKFNPSDLEDRKLWDKYQEAYETALQRCSTTHAPWYVVPADSRTRRDAIAARLIRPQEIARYVLPVATHTCLFHTVSAITLLRYYRVCLQPDTPTEQRYVAEEMIQALLRADPDFETIMESPLEEEMFPESRWSSREDASIRDFLREFDQSLGGCSSRLISYKPENEALLADAVREVLGIPRSRLSDAEATRVDARRPLNGYACGWRQDCISPNPTLHIAYTLCRRFGVSPVLRAKVWTEWNS